MILTSPTKRVSFMTAKKVLSNRSDQFRESLMSKTNVVKLEEAVPSFLKELEERSRQGRTSRILETAKRRGHITVSEIAELLPMRVVKDRGLLSFFVAELGEYLKKIGRASCRERV